MGQRNYNIDAELILKDAGLVAASAAATVGGNGQILSIGRGRFEGVVVIDVTAIEIASKDELYRIVVQGSTSSTFASDIQNLASLELGATEVRDGSAIDSVVGRYELAFCNEQADRIFPFLRLYTFVNGTIATGINYSAYASTIRWG